MKTVRRRSGERRFVLCDPCYAPIRGSLRIVPGEVSVVAKCLACGAYLHPEEMASLAGGGDGKRDVLAGTCRFHGYGDPRLGYDAERDLYSFPDGRFALLGVSDKPCSLGISMNRGNRGEGRSARPRPSILLAASP
jgi:hypothetical protein